MKNIISCLLLIFSLTISAQVTNEGAPQSWKWEDSKSIKSITLPQFNLKTLRAEDAVTDNLNDRPWRFGKEFSVSHSLDNSGEWTTLQNGDRVWRIRFKSEGAVTMNFLFEDFFVPRGGSVYLYSNDRSDLLGAYDHNQNSEEGVLGTWLVEGDDVWIEYHEPAKVKNQGKLMVGKVIHGYRSQSEFVIEKGLNDSGNCNLDVDCPIGEFEDLKNHNKKGVALMLSGGSGFCTGTLINNTTNDGTPYFLTANHCYNNPAWWAFRFNWISPNPVCATTYNSQNGSTAQTISGAQLRARRSATDFLLVEINNNIPAAWDVVWNGWDRTDNIPAKSWGIHHPNGDIMKVCVDNHAPGKLTQNGNQPVWRIHNWELGVTEGGSSGSPLFDPDGKIIGQLWGGSAACIGTNNNGGWDVYGRFAVSWDAGNSPATRLKEWLDPNNSNVTSLNPYPSNDSFANDASLEINNIPEVNCANYIEPILIVKNMGTTPLTSATIAYQLNNGAATTISWTGNLSQGAEDNIALPSISINQDGTFTATISNPNNTTDQNPSNDIASASFEIPEAFETTEVDFTLVPDSYGSETTWELKNSAGAILYAGGPYTNGNVTPITQTFIINTDDCYTFTIFDTDGDGICCLYGAGSYLLTTPDGQVIAQGGDFEESESTTFSNFNILSTTDLLEAGAQISLYPNPSSGIVNISNNTGNKLDYEIYNVLGQAIARGKITGSTHTLNLSQSATGLYFVKMTDVSTNQTTTKKVLLK